MNRENPNREYLLGEYKSRINRVIDYIDQNIDKSLTLDELAQVANFSKFHFNRIFHSFIGEALFQFIQRLRIEKGAYLLLTNPRKSITEIAYECGFSNSAAFARSFKDHFNMTASLWRKTKTIDGSNMGKTKPNFRIYFGNQRKELLPSSVYIDYGNKSQIWRIPMEKEERNVEVRDLPEMTVAYVRHIGPYKGDASLFERLSEKLFKWAGPRNLVNFPETKFLIIYHDDPEITAPDRLRLSVCITVPEETEVDGEVGKMTIPAGRYALARFELTPSDYQEAWDWVYGTWLPQSGFVPDERPCFELYPPESLAHPEGKIAVDICVPVKPL
jgi:AraC family transcriptional regulator